MAWTQKTKASLSGSQKRAKAKAKKSSYSAPSGSQHGRSNVVIKAAPVKSKTTPVVPKRRSASVTKSTAKTTPLASAKIVTDDKAKKAKDLAALVAKEDLAAKQAKDKADAKAKADKIAKDKADYTKAQKAKTDKAAKDKADAKAKTDKIAKDKADAKAKEDLAAKQAKDKADAKAKADKIAKDKADYTKAQKAKTDKAAKDKADAEEKEAGKAALALAAKKAKVKRDNAAKATKDQAAAKVKRDTQAKIAKAEKAQVAKEAKAKALKVAERSDVPVGTAWSGSPHERNQDPLERMPTNDGAGMLGAGVAYYPTGYGETIGDNMPDSALGYLSAAVSPMSATLKTAGKTAWNQQQYGMNEEAGALYKELVQDPANADKSVKELVQMARKPQMDRQLDHAFINNGTANTANESQLANMRPQGITESQWTQMPLAFKRFLTRDMNNGLGSNDSGNGMLTGAPAAPTAPTEPEAPTLGLLTTGGAYGDAPPSWAPQWPQAGQQQAPQPSFAPQWQQQAPQPSFAPQWAPQPQRARSMLGAPRQLQAPPSRFLK